MEMLSSNPGLKRLTAEDHPENRPSTPEDSSGGDIKVRPIGWWRALFGMWLAGVVGSLLTVLMVAYPLGAGDTVAAHWGWVCDRLTDADSDALATATQTTIDLLNATREERNLGEHP